MKKEMKRYLFLIILITLVSNLNCLAQEAYAIHTKSDSTLTFYYDTNMNKRSGWSCDLELSVFEGKPKWWSNILNDEINNITTVVFDSSFANYKPTTMYCWFAGKKKLRTIKGMENLNTSHVSNMGWLFGDCESLKEIDLSHFNTIRVEAMNGMFMNCKSIDTLILKNFNTSYVKNMDRMFEGCSNLKYIDLSYFETSSLSNFNNMFCDCSSLTNLDLSNFDTESATQMVSMFSGCSNLEVLNITSFNTRKVEFMDHMFSRCTSLKTIDLSSFETPNLKYIEGMFYDCNNLKTIIVGKGWTKSNIKLRYSTSVFRNCFMLIGEKGTTYSESRISASYAQIDR